MARPVLAATLRKALRAALLATCVAATAVPGTALGTAGDATPDLGVHALAGPAAPETAPEAASSPLLYPATSELFSAQRRAFLAQSVLHFVPGEEETLEEDGVFTVPAPLPWPPGAGDRSASLVVPEGLPVFVLAALTPTGEPFASMPAVNLNGVPLTGLAQHAVPGISVSDGRSQLEHTAIAFVMAPLPVGRHTLQISCGACASTKGPWLGHGNGGPRTYTLEVRPVARAAAGAESGGTVSLVAFHAPAAPMSPVPAPVTGTVLEKSMQSAALGRSLPYRIYLPAGYEAPDALAAADGGAPLKRYPVLYLLHGLGSGARQWARLGLEAELDRQGAQVIVVTPAGKAGYWVNHADGGPRWGDYVTQDLVAHIDATYRTVPTREGRGIGGISMGGHGALQLALNSPDLFGAVGAHSPAFRTRDQAPAFLGGTTLTLSSAHAPSPDAYAKRDPITLVSRSQATPPALWVDIGESDRWAPRARELETALRDRKWALQWSPRPGDHTNEYWAGRIPDYVSWYRARLEPAAR